MSVKRPSAKGLGIHREGLKHEGQLYMHFSELGVEVRKIKTNYLQVWGLKSLFKRASRAGKRRWWWTQSRNKFLEFRGWCLGGLFSGSHYATKSKFCGHVFSEKRHWMHPQRGKTHIGAQKITHHRNFPMYFHGSLEATHLPGELSLRYVCRSWCCKNSFPGETWASLPSPPKDFPPNGKQNRILPKLTLADKEVFGLPLLTRCGEASPQEQGVPQRTSTGKSLCGMNDGFPVAMPKEPSLLTFPWLYTRAPSLDIL